MNARTDPTAFNLSAPKSERTPVAPRRRGDFPKRVIMALVLMILASGGGWFGYNWWTQARFIESTDDAYLKADIVALSPRVAGMVVSVAVGDNEKVRRGQVLLRIDDRAYRSDEERAEANLAAANAALTNLADRRAVQRVKVEEAEAGLKAAQSQLTLTRADDKRSQRLFKAGFAAESKVDATGAALMTATANRAKAKAVLASAQLQLQALASEQQQLYARRDYAAATVRLARLDLAHTVLRAPRAGIIGNKGVRVGEYVRVGQTLMSLVPRDVYVIANFKETQVAAFKPGMGAEVVVDLLGGTVLHGRIASLSPASGSEFAILPTENATGNFTKVVQRIPVKIHLDRDPSLAGALRAGTSVEASVDTNEAHYTPSHTTPSQATCAAQLAGSTDANEGAGVRRELRLSLQ
jgi:membrane fusion protein, multidrug efflux system